METNTWVDFTVSSSKLGLRYHVTGDVHTFDLRGDLDVYTGVPFRSEMIAFVESLPSSRWSHLALNLSQLKYVDSTGLGLIIGVMKRMSDRPNYPCHVHIHSPTGRIKRILEITGLQKMLNTQDDETNALLQVQNEEKGLDHSHPLFTSSLASSHVLSGDKSQMGKHQNTPLLQYHSCFISHAGADGDFAEKLRNDLMAKGVSCWHFQYDMRGGKMWRTQIEDAIKEYDKLILVCSKQSVERPNVVSEIVSAIEREREQKQQKLFPVRVDDYILSQEMLDAADQKMLNGEWREDWVRYVRAYHVPDFKEWKAAKYDREFAKLLEALQHPTKRD